MKRRVFVVLVLVVVGALAGGWWWARTAPDQAVQVLASGGLEQSQAEEFVTLVGGQAELQEEDTLVASGSIEGETVAIVSEFGGRIVSLDAEEGDEVEVGQVMVELDRSILEAQFAQAQAAVVAAEANLANVRAGAHPAEILAAQAVLRQAIAGRSAAETARDDVKAILRNPQEIDAQIVQARTAVNLAKVQIEQAEAQIASAEAERFQYRGQGSTEEKALYRVHDYQVQAAQAGLEAAKANKAGARETLAALKAIRKRPLALVSQVHAAKAQYEMAVAGVAAAIAKQDEVQAGPTPEEIAVAEAQIAQAQAAVSALQTQRDKMTLRAPMSGVVSSRSARAGETALPGITLLTVANLDEVKLTIYVPENRLAHVHLGQEVEVQVDSFPGRVFTGTVSYIAQQAEFTPKNVQTAEERVNMVFAVRVRLPNPDHLLKPGMPADAILSRN